MPAGRPAGDVAESRKWLDQAKGLADTADAAATIAQTHALLALNDRMGAVLDSFLRLQQTRQSARDDAAIDRAAREHPLVTKDRTWWEARLSSAVTHKDPAAIREASDAINRLRDEERSQYADHPDAMERQWSSDIEVREVQKVEAQIDPDVADSNRRLREEQREQARLDREVRRSTGIFGQMDAGEDG